MSCLKWAGMTLDADLKYLLKNSWFWEFLTKSREDQSKYNYLNVFFTFGSAAFSFENCLGLVFKRRQKMVTTLNQLQPKCSLWAQITPGGFSFAGYIEARLVFSLHIFLFSTSNWTTLQTTSDGCVFRFIHSGNAVWEPQFTICKM